MGFLRHLIQGLRDWRRSDEVDRELADELDHFYAEAADHLVARGVDPAEARRRVRQMYGDEMSAREDVRASLWETALQALVTDLRLAGRRLRRSPGFSAVVVVLLGLGIGAATLIVSVVRPVLFDGLGYPGGERLIAIQDRSEGGDPYPTTFGTYVELRSRATLLDALGVYGPWRPTLTGRAEPELLEGQRVSADFFEVLGVAPRIGAGLDRDDGIEGPDEVVLSHELWTARFDADPEVLGRSLELDGVQHTVVGVMPAGFRSVVRTEAQLWSLLQYPSVSSFDGPQWGHHLGMVGRIRYGVAMAAVREQLAAIASEPTAAVPRPEWAALDNGLVVTPLRDFVTADGRATGRILLGAAALLVIIACVNLSILQLSRGLRRGNEMALRTALGAGRGRLVRQLTTESVLLAGLGGLLGIVVAAAGVGVTSAMLPASLAGLGSMSVDLGTVALAILVTLAVGTLGGVVPALAISRHSSIAGGVRGSEPLRRVARVLIVGEVALAVVLLVGAGLLTRTMERLLSEPYGFDAANTIVLQVRATSVAAGDAGVHQFWDRALQAIRDVPGVRSAATTTQLPLSGDRDVYGVVVDGTGRADGMDGSVFRYAVSPGYHDIMGVPVREGRALRDTDATDAPPVTVVSASLARSLFGAEPAVGEELRIGASGTPFTIVGVVGDVRQESLASDVTEAAYTTPEQWHWADRVRWVAVDVVDAELVDDVKRAVWSVNPSPSIVRVDRLVTVVRRSEARRRFVLTVLGIFAGFALILSGLGLYGVLSSQVAARRREMGIRAALGATRPEIVNLVVRHGVALATVGVAIGVLAAMLLSRGLASLLFGVSGLDPLTYVAVVASFMGLAALACWVPARRAANVDPRSSLAAE